jgi:hypothetical protein
MKGATMSENDQRIIRLPVLPVPTEPLLQSSRIDRLLQTETLPRMK